MASEVEYFWKGIEITSRFGLFRSANHTRLECNHFKISTRSDIVHERHRANHKQRKNRFFLARTEFLAVNAVNILQILYSYA